MGFDDAEVQILLQWKERGREVLESNKLALAEMNAALAYRDALRAAGVISADAETLATATNTDATEENAAAVTEDRHAYELLLPVLGAVGAATAGVSGGLLTAINPFGSWIKLAIDAAIVLAPFVVLLTAAAVITSAFAVSGSAMVAVLGAMSLGFLALGAGVVLLADKMGWVNNSMAQLKAALKEMGADLAQAAAPSANAILQFVTSLIPMIESRGEAVISWFGARLPYALSQMRAVLQDVMPQLDRFGQFLGGIYDHVSTQFAPMAELMTRFGINAVEGLVTNLVHLSDWFQQRLPTYGPVVSQIFSGIGSAVQSTATALGNVSDWFVKNWPAISGDAKKFADNFGSSFDQRISQRPGLPPVDAASAATAVGTALGTVAAALVNIGTALYIVTVQAMSALPTALKTIGDNWSSFVSGAIGDIQNLINAYNSLPGFMRGFQTIPQITNIVPSGMSSSGGGPTSGRGGNGPATGRSSVVVHQYINGSSSPAVTSAVVARNLRKLGVV